VGREALHRGVSNWESDIEDAYWGMCTCKQHCMDFEDFFRWVSSLETYAIGTDFTVQACKRPRPHAALTLFPLPPFPPPPPPAFVPSPAS
jgi:hypothetical protein